MFDRIVYNISQITGVLAFLMACIFHNHDEHATAIWWLLIAIYLHHWGPIACAPKANVEKNDPTYRK